MEPHAVCYLHVTDNRMDTYTGDIFSKYRDQEDKAWDLGLSHLTQVPGLGGPGSGFLRESLPSPGSLCQVDNLSPVHPPACVVPGLPKRIRVSGASRMPPASGLSLDGSSA